MLKKTEQRLEKIIFNSRWLLAPFYLGLVLGIILLFIKFFQYQIFPRNVAYDHPCAQCV